MESNLLTHLLEALFYSGVGVSVIYENEGFFFCNLMKSHIYTFI